MSIGRVASRVICWTLFGVVLVVVVWGFVVTIPGIVGDEGLGRANIIAAAAFGILGVIDLAWGRDLKGWRSMLESWISKRLQRWLLPSFPVRQTSNRRLFAD